jgi:hypothetical protein
VDTVAPLDSMTSLKRSTPATVDFFLPSFYG